MVGVFSLLYEVNAGGADYYELFKVRQRKYTPHGFVENNGYTHYIKYPTNEDFGKWAWCYMDLDKAMVKFKELEDV